jgi:hypothetical protein
MKEELKLFFYRLWPLYLLLIGVPLLSFLVWYFTPNKDFQVLILDKTVRDQTYQEHHGIFWVLNHLKYQKKDGSMYRSDQDYLGFFPNGKPDYGVSKDLKGQSEDKLRTLVKSQDLIYVADTYGVYESDFSEEDQDEFSKKIYGGLDVAEIQMLRIAKEEGKVVIAEYNTMASPTPKQIRTEFENLMGVKWTGWIGRYFDELDTLATEDLPRWMIRQYREQHGAWDLAGPGLIFVKDTGEIEALLFETDYQNKIPVIRSQKVNKHGIRLPELVPYPDWFDVVLIERDYQVISYYDINPTVKGMERLRSMGLPRFFPAAVFRKLTKGSQYYFAGDFSDMRGNLGSPQFKGLPILWRGLHVVADYTDRKSFFWNYYYPLLDQIFESTPSHSD